MCRLSALTNIKSVRVYVGIRALVSLNGEGGLMTRVQYERRLVNDAGS